ncbi:hypothetical protein BOTBODRAFT_127050 [Botryobasidium botryosum FD-172 SS1]|uniref:Programmed cell death protein 2 C-terminal domain-containing protein n=1 Tax=Botryobasidium botryosum (strain FD-172 SS1) TaxID=930990 RepID=A0A067MU60_BOTB1|nr:hypothetical protein BOTBODRAFT_127050 [Botryobasidium botryosum FD-172 SS1]
MNLLDDESEHSAARLPLREHMTSLSLIYHSCISDLNLSFLTPLRTYTDFHLPSQPPLPMSTIDEYSDSDEDGLPQIQTSVLLGFPDGPITDRVDLADPRVSRVGGSPAFHNGVPPPPASSSHCKVCSQPMQLLLQMWCPLEGSAYDRACYVWGCARSRCQRKVGSVRAFRFLKYNEKYAKKLQARREKDAAKLKAAEAAKLAQSQRTAPTSNPFSMKSDESSLDWGADDQLFGAAPAEPAVVLKEESAREEEAEEEGDPSDTEDEEEADVPSLTAALEATSLSSANEWADVASFGPIYLDTASEYIAPPSTARTGSKAARHAGEGGEDGQWGMEGYENIRQINEVFERFLKRTGEEATQCVRYDLSGVPLAYTEDSVYKRLFPIPPPEPGSQTTLTKSAFAVRDTNTRKPTYDPSVVVPCPSCAGPRTFEFQLMPNLINILHPLDESDGGGKAKKVSEEERKRELARVLGVGGGAAGEGEALSMEWGTCLVFSCVSDCCLLDGKEGKSGWYEEEVLVQWE